MERRKEMEKYEKPEMTVINIDKESTVFTSTAEVLEDCMIYTCPALYDPNATA